MKILITGCSGYIGSSLSNYLNKTKKLFFLDKDFPKKFTKIKKNFFKCNLNNFKKTKAIIEKIKPDVIVHLAAKSTVNEKIKKSDYFSNNIIATKNLIKVMNNLNIRNIIFSSTAAVYDKSGKLLKENHRLKPISNYGKSKLLAEKEIIGNKKINFIILRFFNVAGSINKNLIGEFHDPETHLIPVSVFRALNNDSINIFGSNYKTTDGTCIRDYVHVKDICSAIKKSIYYIKKNRSLILNIGSGSGTSNKKVISSLSKIIRKKIETIFLNKRKGDQPILVCNIDKAKKSLNWKPKFSKIDNILKDEIKWSKFLTKNKLERKYLSVQK
jgi:UDP-glucose 4-epimerase